MEKGLFLKVVIFPTRAENTQTQKGGRRLKSFASFTLLPYSG